VHLAHGSLETSVHTQKETRDSFHENGVGEEEQESSVRSSMEMVFSSVLLVYCMICGFMNNTDCEGRGRYCSLSCYMYSTVFQHCSLSLLNIYDEAFFCRFDPLLHMRIISMFYCFQNDELLEYVEEWRVLILLHWLYGPRWTLVSFRINFQGSLFLAVFLQPLIPIFLGGGGAALERKVYITVNIWINFDITFLTQNRS
jgi:hypothetical protein